MHSFERTIQVNWKHRVIFSDHLFDPENETLKATLAAEGNSGLSKALVVVEEAVAHLRPDLLKSISTYFTAHSAALSLRQKPVVRPGGEPAKNDWASVADLHALIDAAHIDRHSYVLAVGGGAFLDAVGFAAATAHRGVRHVRIPTTTLSQCDSGVGVKNGINAFGKKNFLGSFAPPFAVLNDFQLLATLPARDKRAGYSEAVKVACIRDREFFETLEQHALRLARFEPESMRQLIQRCAELHVNHIAGCGDPFEMGSARPLDFGHWSAHKLEQLSGFEVRHGEAVAMGIALDVLYSRRLGWLDPAEAERVLLLLEALGFELYTKEMSQRDPRGSWRLLEGLEEFREHLGGRLTLTLLRKIGVGMEVHEIDSAQMLAALEELSTRVLSRTARPAPLAAARCAQLS